MAAGSERSRLEERPENRKPLYEWIDSVEERLDAMETERTGRDAA